MQLQLCRLPTGPATSAAVVLALLFTSVAAAQSSSVIARASSVTGSAVLTSPGLSPLALTAGFILNPGDRIDTRGGGRVVIDLSDGSMVVVSPESVVVLKDYRAASSLRELFEITIGIVRVKINHFAGKPNPYRMNSPTASIAVRGTEFSIEVTADGGTQVVVYEGAVEVSSLSDPARRVLIEAGRGVLVQAGQDFHLLAGGNLGPPARDGGDRNVAADRDRKPPAPAAAANVKMPDGHGDAPPPPNQGGPPAPQGLPPQPQAVQGSQGPGGSQGHDHEESSPRATAGTYDRYLASLVDIGQLPFLFRFNAFPEAHLDSLENPAYASGFQSAEGRIFILPTFRGARTLQEYQSAFGPTGGLPSDYSISPQISFFAPSGKYTFGGSLSLSRVGNTSVTSTPEYAPGTLEHNTYSNTSTSGDSSTTYYSAALVAARRFGANSFGVELSALKGTGSLSSVTRESDGPGRLAEENISSASDITQTRITAGYSRDLSRNTTIGVFYRYAFIRADDRDVSHTLNHFPAGLNNTRTGGHSSEFGMRLRGLLTPRLYYGLTAAWLGISLLDGMTRTTTVDSHERDRAQRGSVGIGLGYALTRSTTLSFDLAGGTARTWASRTEDATRVLLQNAVADGHFASSHAAIQSDITRRLFLTASFLQVWQSHGLNVDLFPDRFGNRTSVEDSFFSMNPANLYASRFSDYGAGWRFTPNLFAQYVFSTDYGVTSATHTLMLRYTFHPGGR
ncbi:MAG: hypothetical protein JWP63_2523 [Candidatus Solibacter sp.]|nr:hypothetical protein [Candidatus Solibacter sp.]